jgi:hypothetical protein
MYSTRGLMFLEGFNVVTDISVAKVKTASLNLAAEVVVVANRRSLGFDFCHKSVSNILWFAHVDEPVVSTSLHKVSDPVPMDNLSPSTARDSFSILTGQNCSDHNNY